MNYHIFTKLTYFFSFGGTQFKIQTPQITAHPQNYSILLGQNPGLTQTR